MPKQSREGMTAKAPSGSLLADDFRETTYIGFRIRPVVRQGAVKRLGHVMRAERRYTTLSRR
jgi:hypothetical protein